MFSHRRPGLRKKVSDFQRWARQLQQRRQPRQHHEEQQLSQTNNNNNKNAPRRKKKTICDNSKQTENSNLNFTIPVLLIHEHILPFLDRTSWNNTSMMCRELRSICCDKKLNNSPIPPWPTTFKFRFNYHYHAEAMSFSCDGKILAVGEAKGWIHFFNCWDGVMQKKLFVPTDLGLTTISFSPTNPNLLAIGSYCQPVILWDLSKTIQGDNRLIQNDNAEIMITGRPTGCIAWSSDGQLIASVYIGGILPVIRLFQVSNQRLIHELTITNNNHNGNDNHDNGSDHNNNNILATRVAFSPSGQYFAASNCTSLYVWDLKSHDNDNNSHPTKVATRDDLLTFAFSPCNQYIATTGYTGIIQLWDLYKDVTCVAKFGNQSAINHIIMFDPNDATKVITGGYDCILRVWQINDNNNNYNNSANQNYCANNGNNNNQNNMQDEEALLFDLCGECTMKSPKTKFIHDVIAFTPNGARMLALLDSSIEQMLSFQEYPFPVEKRKQKKWFRLFRPRIQT